MANHRRNTDMRTAILLACGLWALAGLAVAQAQAPNPNPSPAGKQCQQACYNAVKQCEANLPRPTPQPQYYECTNKYGSCMTACPQ